MVQAEIYLYDPTKNQFKLHSGISMPLGISLPMLPFSSIQNLLWDRYTFFGSANYGEEFASMGVNDTGVGHWYTRGSTYNSIAATLWQSWAKAIIRRTRLERAELIRDRIVENAINSFFNKT